MSLFLCVILPVSFATSSLLSHSCKLMFVSLVVLVAIFLQFLEYFSTVFGPTILLLRSLVSAGCSLTVTYSFSHTAFQISSLFLIFHSLASRWGFCCLFFLLGLVMCAELKRFVFFINLKNSAISPQILSFSLAPPSLQLLSDAYVEPPSSSTPTS